MLRNSAGSLLILIRAEQEHAVREGDDAVPIQLEPEGLAAAGGRVDDEALERRPRLAGHPRSARPVLPDADLFHDRLIDHGEAGRAQERGPLELAERAHVARIAPF